MDRYTYGNSICSKSNHPHNNQGNTYAASANWKCIEEWKRLLIKKQNKRENFKRTHHTHQVGDQVLIKQTQETKYGKNIYKALTLWQQSGKPQLLLTKGKYQIYTALEMLNHIILKQKGVFYYKQDFLPYFFLTKKV